MDLRNPRKRREPKLQRYARTEAATGSPRSGPKLERASDIIPLGRTGTPDDIAKAVVFLASEDSSYTTAGETRLATLGASRFHSSTKTRNGGRRPRNFSSLPSQSNSRPIDAGGPVARPGGAGAYDRLSVRICADYGPEFFKRAV